MTEEKSPAAGGPSTGGFRRDVQGLRALAVLLVVVDHADIGPVHGGFIGVDVFFVVSGFLITGLLLDRADKDGRVRLVDFYARRARRILPAATLVLAVDRRGGLLPPQRHRRPPALQGRGVGDLLRRQHPLRPARRRLQRPGGGHLGDPALLVAGGGGAVLPGVAAGGARPGGAHAGAARRPPRGPGGQPEAGHPHRRRHRAGVVRVRALVRRRRAQGRLLLHPRAGLGARRGCRGGCRRRRRTPTAAAAARRGLVGGPDTRRGGCPGARPGLGDARPPRPAARRGHRAAACRRCGARPAAMGPAAIC